MELPDPAILSMQDSKTKLNGKKGKRAKEKELQIHPSPKQDRSLSRTRPQAHHLSSKLRYCWCL